MIKLAIVRRYVDMNGRYIGELYLNGIMIGASQDNLPLEYKGGRFWFMDTWRSFLSPLTWRTVRVGGIEPANDGIVRRRLRWLLPFSTCLSIENRLIDDLVQPMKVK